MGEDKTSFLCNETLFSWEAFEGEDIEGSSLKATVAYFHPLQLAIISASCRATLGSHTWPGLSRLTPVKLSTADVFEY